jgi:hypothetical protein
MPVIERGVGLDRTVYKLPVSRDLCLAALSFDFSLCLSPSFSDYLCLSTSRLIPSSPQALVVDDFSYVTPDLVYSAYVEAVYRQDEWEYERLTLPFWKDLMRNASVAQSSDVFYRHFPKRTGD